MTKSQLIERIAHKQSLLTVRDVELAVKVMLEHMATCLAEGGRIEIRGFGSFSLHFRPARARQLLAAFPSGAGGAQPEDRNADSAVCEVRPLLQAGQGSAHARRSVDARSTRGFGRRVTVHRGTRARGPH